MSSNTTKVVSSFPVVGVLGVAFIVLKLTHVIDWSWWWVLAPFWIGPAVVAAILTLVLGITFLATRNPRVTKR